MNTWLAIRLFSSTACVVWSNIVKTALQHVASIVMFRVPHCPIQLIVIRVMHNGSTNVDQCFFTLKMTLDPRTARQTPQTLTYLFSNRSHFQPTAFLYHLIYSKKFFSSTHASHGRLEEIFSFLNSQNAQLSRNGDLNNC